MATQTETQTFAQEFPSEVQEYINSKVQNGSGGRPHWLKEISHTRDPKDVLLEIVEQCWMRDKPARLTAKNLGVKHLVIYRILQDLTPWKDLLIKHLETAPRTKVFYNAKLDASDYETVQAYIARAHRMNVRRYKERLYMAERVWKALNRKDPSRWKADEVQTFLNQQSEGNQSGFLDGIRMVAPQIRDKYSTDYIPVGQYRDKLKIRKKDIFSDDMIHLVKALKKSGLDYHSTIFKFHATGAFREGQHDDVSGITGISWDRFKDNFTKVDDYEGKTKGGIMWENCPVDLFWKTLPQELKQIWIDRGKPITEKVILGGYHELLKIYKEMRECWKQYFKPMLDSGEIDPYTYKEYTSIRPHDADKIHVNMLWEADVKLEIVAGQYLGKRKGLGLVGRGWQNIDIIKKHYLSLTQRSPKFKQVLKQIADFSQKFNGGH